MLYNACTSPKTSLDTYIQIHFYYIYALLQKQTNYTSYKSCVHITIRNAIISHSWIPRLRKAKPARLTRHMTFIFSAWKTGEVPISGGTEMPRHLPQKAPWVLRAACAPRSPCEPVNRPPHPFTTASACLTAPVPSCCLTA